MTSIADIVQPGTPVIPENAVFVGPNPPPNPADGDLWFDTAGDLWKRWAGTTNVWVAVTGGAGGAQLPVATRPGQVLVAGAAPTFNWNAGDIDAGRI